MDIINHALGSAYQRSAQPVPVHKRKYLMSRVHAAWVKQTPERPVHSVPVFQEKEWRVYSELF